MDNQKGSYTELLLMQVDTVDNTSQANGHVVIQNAGYHHNNKQTLDIKTSFMSEKVLQLLRLEYPQSDEVHSTGVAQKEQNSTDQRPNGGLFDEISVICDSSLAKKLAWKYKVDKAVEDETIEFRNQVEQKTQELQIDETEAIFEVYADRIAKTKGDKALLWIVTIDTTWISKICAEIFVTILLQRGANAAIKDENLNTLLHHAAKRGWTSIAKKLVECRNTACDVNKDGHTPLELAILETKNECATFLVKSMEPMRVRDLFKGNEQTTFYTLLDSPGMQTTVLAILDAMMEPLEGNPDSYIVYYSILDSDEHGHDPYHPDFKESCLYKMAMGNNKEVVNHHVVRLLIRHKWKLFARYRLLAKFILFLVHTIIMTLALVLAAKKQNPSLYDEGVDVFRGICEVVLVLCVMYNVFREMYKLKRHKKDYFTDYFNYLNSGANLFTLLIIPFRIMNSPIQWYFASVGYFCQIVQGFEFAAAFRSTGTYLQILPRIIVHDMVPFSVVFSLFLFAFTGAFYFALRGEEFVTTAITYSNCTSEINDEFCIQNFTTVESTSLDVFPSLTKQYYHVLFTNLRVMIESEDIIDEYYGPNGFGWLSVIIYTVFLFLVLTVLLNLLIAQMSDTYANVQSDAQRALVMNRAWIVAKAEYNSLFTSALFDCGKKKYLPSEVVENPFDELDKWETPPISHMNKQLTKVHGLITQQKFAAEQVKKELQSIRLQQMRLIELINKLQKN